MVRTVKGYFCSVLLSNICWLSSLSAGSTPAFCSDKFVCPLGGFEWWKPLAWRFYLYIGITSLYLYNTAGSGDFQDGILHKNVLCKSFKREKLTFWSEKRLTAKNAYDMIFLLRAVIRRPFCYAKILPQRKLPFIPSEGTPGRTGDKLDFPGGVCIIKYI